MSRGETQHVPDVMLCLRPCDARTIRPWVPVASDVSWRDRPTVAQADHLASTARYSVSRGETPIKVGSFRRALALTSRGETDWDGGLPCLVARQAAGTKKGDVD